jgi:hypothetical protein
LFLLSDKTHWGANEVAEETKSALPDTTDCVFLAYKACMNEVNSGNEYVVTVIPFVSRPMLISYANSTRDIPFLLPD